MAVVSRQLGGGARRPLARRTLDRAPDGARLLPNQLRPADPCGRGAGRSGELVTAAVVLPIRYIVRVVSTVRTPAVANTSSAEECRAAYEDDVYSAGAVA